MATHYRPEAEKKERGWVAQLARENWFRVVVFVALCANLWLSQKYVTRDEYNADRKELTASIKNMTESLNELKTTLAVRDAASNDKVFIQQLADHEARIRELERKQKTN